MRFTEQRKDLEEGSGVAPENAYRPGSATDGVDEGHPFAEGLPWLSLVDTNSHGEGRGGWLSGRGSRRCGGEPVAGDPGMREVGRLRCAPFVAVV
jgi:hypothetical protein